ncbi:MAG: glyoxalase [Eubacterium sp.]|nr:glyoxalase [Eubacterium sp.]
METYDDECLEVFLRKQKQLFRETVASSLEEAEAFLEDCMAVVCKNLEEVKEYFEESGMDISGMGDLEIEEASEVFALSGGRYLVVVG